MKRTSLPPTHISPGGFRKDLGPNNSVSGDWVRDIIAIGNATMNGVDFGIAYDSAETSQYSSALSMKMEYQGCDLFLWSRGFPTWARSADMTLYVDQS